MLKPEGTELTMLARMATKTCSTLCKLENVLVGLAGMELAGDLAGVRAPLLVQLRQATIETGENLTQLRMAVAQGAEIADQVFTTAQGYEGLSEEQVKALKELTA